MSNRKRAIRAINLEPTDRIPGWELLSNPDFETQLTGIDAYENPQRARIKTLQLLDIDVATPPLQDNPQPRVKDNSSMMDSRGGKVIKWGAGTSWRWDHGFMFKDIDDILDFNPISFFVEKEQKVIFEDIDPVQRYLHLPVKKMAMKLNERHKTLQNLVGNYALVPGGYYRTLIMWPLMLFGWQLFSELALLHRKEFKRIWEQFAQISKKVTEAYSLSNIELFISHDDLCMTKGPIFNPEWYKENLYPYYEEIWSPLKKKGIKVVFVSDGKLDEVLDDVLAAGADGFVCECYTDLKRFAKKYGKEKVIVGNIDSRILQFGNKRDIRREVERCTKFGKECPGYFYCASGHLTWNIPVENIKYYFECCRELGKR